MTTLFRSRWIRSLSICLMAATGFALTSGLGCGSGGGLPGAGDGGGSSDTPTGAILSPTSNVNLENGQSTNIQYFAQSPSSAAKLDVYLDRDSSRGNGNEIELINGIDVPAGTGGTSGSLTFNSTNVPNGTYFVFGNIHYGDGLAQTLTFVSAGAVVVTPVGSQPRPEAPTVRIIDPFPSLGVSSQDTVQLQYEYTSPSSGVTLTLLLDKDRIPTNDDISNPGDPNDPSSKIIILPSTPRDVNDPTFGNDPPPPDNPNAPPTNVDSVEIRKNPRQLAATTSSQGPVAKIYRFSVDLARIPPRSDGSPYFIRATISDGINPPVHSYAVGSLTVTSLATGSVDLAKVGQVISGARFLGFNQGEFLGSRIVKLDDLDSDGNDDMMFVSRFGSPRNRVNTGAAYLLFGRHKTPYPPDTNGNGLPDTRDQNGNVVDFPAPPTFIYNPAFLGNVSPYDPTAVGRFGGTININSISSLAGGAFYRGVVYTMPASHEFFNPCEGSTYTLPPPALRDVDHPGNFSSGLTSVARLDLTGDGIRDFVFGLPFISNPRDFHDDDPCDPPLDETTDPPTQPCYFDGFPNECGTAPPTLAPNNLDAISNVLPFVDPPSQLLARRDLNRLPRELQEMPIGSCNPANPQPEVPPVDTGLMIVVSGANDIANTFRQFVDAAVAGMVTNAATYPRLVVDEEGVIRGEADVPIGMRMRGAWFPGPNTQSPLQWYPRLDSYNEWATDLAGIPSVDNDPVDDLLVSAPGAAGQQGYVKLFFGQDFVGNATFYADTAKSLPSYQCTDPDPDSPGRGFRPIPVSVEIDGATAGDRLGGARGAGQVDQDSKPDIIMGAPMASRAAISLATHLPSGVPLTNNGVFYILFQPPGGYGPAQFPVDPPNFNDPVALAQWRQLARFEIRGTHTGDRFGEVQEAINDLNGDGVDDVAFASQYFPATPDASINHSVGSGYVGVIFGRRQITAENGFRPEEVGTSRLPGVRFYGASGGAAAGASIAGAGDFDGDGYGDLLIACPGEVRPAPDGSGQLRRGVAYLIYGGTHLEGHEFTLSQVGSTALPGIVMVSPYQLGTADEATIETVAGVGDVDGDGFDDIALGLPHADFVFPNAPDQRRRDAGNIILIYGNNLGRN